MARNWPLILLDLQGSTPKFLPEFPYPKSFSFCTSANPSPNSFRMRSYRKGGRGVGSFYFFGQTRSGVYLGHLRLHVLTPYG